MQGPVDPNVEITRGTAAVLSFSCSSFSSSASSSFSANANNNKIMDDAVQDMMSAIDMLPNDKKASFGKAMQVCPELVQDETPPKLFLEYDNFNYWKAAERLAMHWTEREKIFGSSRAFLPMTQTGNGALTKDDVVTLHTGSHARLAPTPSGQPVLFTDRRRILAKSTRESRTRCFWYLVFHVAREENAAKYGILFLALVVTPRESPLDYAYFQHGVRILQVMPATFHMHLLNNVPKTGKFSVGQKLVQSMASYIAQFLGGLGIVTETCQGDIKQKLMELGCVPEGLPASVGGDWKYEDYTRWCRRRITEEQYFEELYSPSSKNESTMKMTAERKKERTKCLNVLHSRQKRERRKAEQAKMEEDCNQLKKEFFALKKESARLEDLLEQAQRIVHQCEACGHFSLQTSMSNSFDPIPSNVLSSSTPAPAASYEPSNVMSAQRAAQGAFQGMLSMLGMQPNLNQQSMNPPLQSTPNMQTDNSIINHSMNQLGNQMMTLGNNNPSLQTQTPLQNMNALEMNQPFMNNILSTQQQTMPSANSMTGNSSQQPNWAMSLQQAMMPSISMQTTVAPVFAQCGNNIVQPQIQSGMKNFPGPFEAPSVHVDPSFSNVAAPTPYTEVHSSSFVTDAPGSAPPSNRTTTTTLCESVPQEFAGFDIEPDPLRETPLGVPTYQQSNHNYFF